MLSSVQYANGQSISYNYDTDGNITSLYYGDTLAYTYIYDTESTLTSKTKKSKKIINWYEVYGDKNNYTIFFVEWAEDTFDKDNVGLYTLRIIEEKDFDEQFMEHSKMEIAGIYYNPTTD